MTQLEKRSVFFVSDGTGITVETFGLSLLTQFESIHFEKITVPYVNNLPRAEELCREIHQAYLVDGKKPLVFTTLIDQKIRDIISTTHAICFDLLSTFIDPLEKELGCQSSHKMGLTHSIQDNRHYMVRMEAVNFALSSDDGCNAHQYQKADFILVGVSRCGKTPTCLYLALQFGISAANYPLTEEDMEHSALPPLLEKFHSKLFGLTIDPKRLHQIRQERRPNSRYASLKQCTHEVEIAEDLFQKQRIPFIDTTQHSIEEIATAILVTTKTKRKL